MNEYLQRTIDNVREKYSHQPEFVQTVEEVLGSLEPVIDQHPEFEKVDLLGRMVEPDRSVSFRVVWQDDEGNHHTNTGYRVQFNGAIGPYKGGIRFNPTVTESVIKFLGFEQTFKNGLTGLPMGGGKGGSDFDPRGKSDDEIMRFCQSFITALFDHLGPDVDVPAGDMGVAGREIGFMFGQYRRIKKNFENGTFTGKDLSYGGSILRPEATGFGAVYYLNNILKHEGLDMKDQRVAVSGFGNVSWGICKKIAELGGKAVTIAGPDGFVYDPDGIITEEKIEYLRVMRASGRDRVQDYSDKFPSAKFFAKEKPWNSKEVDFTIAMPAAYQNEITMTEAKSMVEKGVQYYIEVANMPTTNDALNYLIENCKVVAPSKAVNAGGVACSGLEMSQNSQRLAWTAEEVDKNLHAIMDKIYNNCVEAAEEYGLGYNLVAGANIAGFKRVSEAMMAQGVI